MFLRSINLLWDCQECENVNLINMPNQLCKKMCVPPPTGTAVDNNHVATVYKYKVTKNQKKKSLFCSITSELAHFVFPQAFMEG